MQLKSVEQPEQALKYFQDSVGSSMKQINVARQFMQSVHKLCRKFGDDLQHLYLLLSVQLDDEESLVQNTSLSNYILSISQVIKNRADVLYEEAIEPFQQFEENYVQLNKNIINDFEQIVDNLKTSNTLLRLKQTEYYDGKTKKQIFSNETTEQQYRLALQSKNTNWEQYFKVVPQHFESFQLNDESRVSIMEQTYCKFVDVMEVIFQQPAHNTIKKLKASFKSQKQKLRSRDLYTEMITSSKKMLDFMSDTKCDQFISRDDHFRAQTAMLLQAADLNKNEGLNEDDYKLIKISLDHGINYPTNIIYKLKIIPNFGFKERDDVINQLMSVTKNQPIKLNTNFQIRLFTVLFIRLFKCYEQELMFNQKYTQQLLQMIQICLMLRRDDKFAILALVSPHCELFYQQRTWTSLFDEIANNYQVQKQLMDITIDFINPHLSVSQSITMPKQIQQQTEKSLFGMVNLFKQQPQRKLQPQETLTIVNMILIATNINPSMSSAIIIEFTKIHGLKLTDSIPYIEVQEGNHMLKPLKPQMKHKYIHQKVQQRKQVSLYCLFKCLKFLDFKESYLSVIVLSKELSKEIRDKMIQYRLITHSAVLTPPEERLRYWTILLDTDSNYHDVQQKFMLSSRKLSRETEHSIFVDIKRSFNTHVGSRDNIIQVYEEKLERLLKLIAFDNPEVSYYQGMNMLMVFLLYITDVSEEKAFKLFRALLDKMLREMFLDGLKSMKMQFFILDRLIAIYLPDLFIYWKKLQLESPQFATPWYVTLYTYAVQLDDPNSNETCFSIFDLIVAKGWPGFYRATITLLSFYQSQLMRMDFDQTHRFLNSLTKSSFNMKCKDNDFMDIHPLTNIKKKQVIIKKSMIKEIEKEYYQLREKIDYINFNKL